MIEENIDPELTEEERELLSDLPGEDQPFTEFGLQRRDFIKQVLAAGGSVAALQLAGGELLAETTSPESYINPPNDAENVVQVTFNINGTRKTLKLDSRMTLLDSLREKLGLTGAKKGCDHGQCGACTVLSDGQRILSCLTLAASCEGRSITTIEGLSKNGKLHPMQHSFLNNDGFQCGFCTPGQICSAVALLKEAKNGDASYITANLQRNAGALQLSPDEIRERMSGNICRCGAYPNIVTAIQEVINGSDASQAWSFIPQDHSSI